MSSLFKKPRINYPITPMDTKNLNDFMETIMFKMFGNIDFADLGTTLQKELKYNTSTIKLLDEQIILRTSGEDGSAQMSLTPGAVQFAFNDITGETNRVTIGPSGITINKGAFIGGMIDINNENGAFYMSDTSRAMIRSADITGADFSGVIDFSEASAVSGLETHGYATVSYVMGNYALLSHSHYQFDDFESRIYALEHPSP